LLLINQTMSDIQLSAEDQQKLDAAALKIQARARGMNTRRMSKDDLAVKAQESKRETKEERQARRKAEIQAANAKRHAEFEAEAQLDSAAPPEQSDAQAADEPAAPAAAAEAVTLSVPVDIFHGLSEEERLGFSLRTCHVRHSNGARRCCSHALSAVQSAPNLHARADWDSVRFQLLVDVLNAKFNSSPNLCRALLRECPPSLVAPPPSSLPPFPSETGTRTIVLIDTDDWSGMCAPEGLSRGHNNVGKALMQVRHGLSAAAAAAES
jgi:hypothetical protein